MKTKIFTFAIFLYGLQFCHAQGFVNLGFESANLFGYGSGTGPAVVPTNNAIPGWTAYLGGFPQSAVLYDGVTLGGAMISLQDTNAVFVGSAVQGNYSVVLLASSAGPPTTAAIGQTGTIPNNAQSLTFWGNVGGMQVTFNGQPIDYLVTGSTANYVIYSADISAYAGQTGQLLFTALAGNSYASGGLIDNIQFSTTPVPEPSTLALAAFGGLLLGSRRWKRFSN